MLERVLHFSTRNRAPSSANRQVKPRFTAKQQSSLLKPTLLYIITLLMILTSPLTLALAQLQKNIGLTGSMLARDNPELVETFRTATIKSFEYAYELSVRLIRRALAAKASVPSEIEELEFRVLLRRAAEQGLIDDPQLWFLFREKRNITSHTYDVTQALDVLSIMPVFVEKVLVLLKHLAEVPDAHP